MHIGCCLPGRPRRSRRFQAKCSRRLATADPAPIYENAGASKIYGGTLDLVGRPWSGGTFTLAAEYAHSRYTSFVYGTPAAFFNSAASGCTGSPSATMPGYTNVNCSGFQTLKTPEWTVSASFTQTFDIPFGTLTPSVDATYVDARWLGIEFTPIERAKSYTMIDALATFQPTRGNWTITAFGRNLTDARTYQQSLVNPLSGLVTANIGPPRTFGGRIAYNF